MTVSTAITGLQIITTAAIILVPVLTNHPINPLQRRADKALNRLRRRNDNINELCDFSQAVEDPQTEEDLAFKTMFELGDDDIDELDEIDQAFESGYLQPGDPGFRILLDAVSNNRSIDKSEVTAIGLLFGDVAILNKMDTNEDMPEGSRVPIGPNAALFVDYEAGAIPDRELITYYPESPSLTLSLHELELWLKEEIRRKSHYVVIVLTLIWTTSSLLSTVV